MHDCILLSRGTMFTGFGLCDLMISTILKSFVQYPRRSDYKALKEL